MKWVQKQGARAVRDKIMRFLDKQGFYIILVVCLLAIGGVAIWAGSNRQQMAKNPEEDVTDVVMQQGDDPWPDVTMDVVTEVGPRTFDAAQATRTSTKSATKDQTTGQNAQAVMAMLAPTSGELGLPFASNQLVYSKTLKQWTTHVGVDIACNEGDLVRASLAGTVDKVEKNALLGYTVTLSHANDTKTVYANLQDIGLPTQGSKVERGDTIGYAGNTAVGEIEEGTHLHFEVYQGGVAIDPSVFFAPKSDQE